MCNLAERVEAVQQGFLGLVRVAVSCLRSECAPVTKLLSGRWTVDKATRWRSGGCERALCHNVQPCEQHRKALQPGP